MPWPKTVGELGPEAAFGDHPARGPVHLLAGCKQRLPKLDRGGLGVVDQVVDLRELEGGVLPEPDRAGDVGGVARHPAAAVDEDGRLPLEGRAGRSAVRQGARRAELHQAVALGAAPFHLVREQPRRVVLAHPDRELRERGRERLFGDGDGAPDQGDFLRSLDAAAAASSHPSRPRTSSRRAHPSIRRRCRTRWTPRGRSSRCRAASGPARTFFTRSYGLSCSSQPRMSRMPAVRLDAVHFECRAHDGGIARRRHDQRDQALARTRVVTGEVAIVGTGHDDEHVPLARRELGLRARDALGECCGAERGLLVKHGGKAGGREVAIIAPACPPSRLPARTPALLLLPSRTPAVASRVLPSQALYYPPLIAGRQRRR